jgi:ABC-type uncharacterized transport system permease subunit
VRRGLPYAALALCIVAMVLIGVHAARHPTAGVAETLFAVILTVAAAFTSVLRIRSQRRSSRSG